MNVEEDGRHARCMVHVLSAHKLPDSDAGDKPVLTSPEQVGVYKFVYSYPLRNTVEIEHEFTTATSFKDIVVFGKEDYEKIYAEEDATTPIPAKDSIPLAGGLTLMNRTRTEGKHGIWGHVLNDLYFEGIHIDFEKRTVTFDMGS